MNTERNPIEIVDIIRKDGIVVIENFISQDEVLEIKKDLMSIFSKMPDRASSTDGNQIELDAYSFGKAIRFSRSSNFNSINKLFNNRWCHETASRYLGPTAQINLQTFASNEYITEDKAGEWTRNHYLHFDPFRALKFYVYLTDTDESNGSFRCVPGTHHECRLIRETYRMEELFQDKYQIQANQDKIKWTESDCKHINGKAGTLLVFDTDIIHGGGLIKEEGKERMVIINHNR